MYVVSPCPRHATGQHRKCSAPGHTSTQLLSLRSSLYRTSGVTMKVSTGAEWTSVTPKPEASDTTSQLSVSDARTVTI